MMTAEHDEPVAPPSNGRVPLDPGERVDLPYRYGDPFDPNSVTPTTRAERAGLKSAMSGLTAERIEAFLTTVPKAAGEPDVAYQPPRPEDELDYELRRDRLLLLQDRPGPEHDAAMDGRPDGCWCVGAGGRDLKAIVPLVDGRPVLPRLPDGEHPPQRFAISCICPEAEAERTRAQAATERLKSLYLEQRVARLVGAARIPPGYRDLSLLTFPDRKLAAQMDRWYRGNVQRLEERAAGRPTDPERDEALKPSVLLWGRNRTGKTGLALGCVQLAIDQRRGAIFRTMPDLLDELRASYDPDNAWCHADLLAVLKDVPLLVLDDFGAQRMTTWATETIYVLLNHRLNEQLMTIFTSNLHPDALLDHLGERDFWRVREPSHLVEMNGPLIGEAGRIVASSANPFGD